jgi:hypothetical protein
VVASQGCGLEGKGCGRLITSGNELMRRDRTQLALICFPVMLAVAAIITAVVLFITSPRRPLASQADCDRVEVGMTHDQVEQVLGGPPGDYRTGIAIPHSLSMYAAWDKWLGDGGTIVVDYDADGRVSFKDHFDHELVIRRRSWIERIMSR